MSASIVWQCCADKPVALLSDRLTGLQPELENLLELIRIY